VSVAGKRILVTGAGKGIGRETVVTLNARGAKVVALSRDPADLASLAAETGCEKIAVDLAHATAARTAVERALPLDGLVNCAGIVRLADFLDTSLDDFDQTMAVNIRAPMVVAQAVVRDWLARGATGAIVNVSSVAAKLGFARHTAYCASKAALDAMTRVMAVELGGHGIRVNSVNPTITLTPMGHKAWGDPARARPMLERLPLGRFAAPGELASVIAFLLGDEAAMIHGASIAVDGGFQAR
jgi:NAD(P)-dependent dehydrogenase (short-subunit alcohol dehydrogenase family)